MQKLILILVLFFAFAPRFDAQKVLVLDKVGVKFKRIKYYSGDFIAIRIFNDRTIYKGELNAISDTSFFINGNYVLLDSVQYVIKYSKGAKGLSYTAFTVAVVTTSIMLIDLSIKGEIAQVPSQLGVPAAFAGLGLLMIPFWKKSIRLGKNKILKVLDLTPY